jgi:hypothetical protein
MLFVASGCAALIYEVVWLQLLQFTIGSSAISLAVLLGTFMGGMGLGSLWAPRWGGRRHHPLRTYALIELALAVTGLAVLHGLPALSEAYVALVGRGAPSVLLRSVIAACCLLPPTVLMGATLPVVARHIAHRTDNAAWLGFFYGGNTAGAVLGCLLAGFYLLRLHDLATATGCAITINLAAATIAWFLARREQVAAARSDVTPVTTTAATTAEKTRQRTLLWVAGLSGFSALAAEVVWTRTFALLFGASVYTFRSSSPFFSPASQPGVPPERRSPVDGPRPAFSHCVNCCSSAPSSGLRTRSRSACHSMFPLRQLRLGIAWASIWGAAPRPYSPPRCCGALRFRSCSRPSPRATMLPSGLVAPTPPTPSAPSSAA